VECDCLMLLWLWFVVCDEDVQMQLSDQSCIDFHVQTNLTMAVSGSNLLFKFLDVLCSMLVLGGIGVATVDALWCWQRSFSWTCTDCGCGRN